VLAATWAWPMSRLHGVRAPGAVTVPAANTVAWREAVAQWPMDEEVDGLSKRGSRDGRRTRGGGSEAYPVAVRHEGVEAVRRGGTLRRRQTLVEGGGWRQVLEIVEDERRMSRGEIDLEDDRRWRSPRDRIHDGGW
jgi:hypothetical protein